MFVVRMPDLVISCVLYKQNQDEVKGLLESLNALVGNFSFKVVFVDNSPNESLKEVVSKYTWAEFLKNPDGNTGFGSGHNLAMQNMGKYHLVINPDVELAPDALRNALAFMETNPECGLLAPEVFNGKSEQEFLCRCYPGILDIALRGFAPERLKNLFRSRLERYEMRDLINDEVLWDPPLVSGCFMLFRSSVLKQLGGFDAAFFLYFEDYDISLRAAKISRIAYVPAVKIVHYGGGAARKGLRHVYLFAQSAITFFNKHGWRFV